VQWLNRKETRQKSVVDEFFAWDNEMRPHGAFDLSEAESYPDVLQEAGRTAALVHPGMLTGEAII
jgi:hypothetical protein